MHWRHEQLSLRMAWVTATHHSFDKVHAEHAAPRSQRTGTPAGEGEVFESREAPRAQKRPHPRKRREPLEEVGVGFELVLDPVLPQLAREDERQVAEKWVELVDEHTCKAYFWNPLSYAISWSPSKRKRKKKEEAEDSLDLFILLSWPRSSATSAVASSWLVFWFRRCSRCVPFVRRHA